MGKKLNVKLMDQKYVSTKIKNSDTGRKWTQIQCPLCQISFDLREFEDHANKTHAFRIDELYSRLFGINKLKCDCGRDLHFNPHLGIFPRKCNGCQSTQLELPTDTLTKGKSSEEIDELIRLEEQRSAERLAKLREERDAQKTAEEFSRINFRELRPKLNDQVKLFIRKLAHELRPYIVSCDKEKAFELLNYVDNYVATEPWKDKEVKDG